LSVGLALVIGGMTGCDQGAGSTSSAAPTLAQVTALLQRHAAAVRRRSASDFLADVDTSPAAATFRARQAAQIADIAAVPLQSWSYSASSVVTEAGVTAAQQARFAAPALVVHVSLSYALRYVDPQPTSHDLWWTFVQRHGHVYLAGDDALAAEGASSWVGPWDFGPVLVDRGRSSLILGHPQNRSQLAALARTVDAAVPVVTGVWGTGWARQVAVIVPGTTAELTALVDTQQPLSDVSAETVFDAQDPVTGEVSGQRVIMNPATLATLTPAGLRIVLQHEITHVASAASTTQASPRWLVEGFAEYVGDLGSGQPVPVAAAELASQVAAGQVPSALPANAAFTPGSAGLAQTYELAWLACRLIAQQVGQAGLVRLYRAVGASAAQPAAALAAALQSVLHESVAAFVTQWRGYLRAELG
jgi:hypothetical protein